MLKLILSFILLSMLFYAGCEAAPSLRTTDSNQSNQSTDNSNQSTDNSNQSTDNSNQSTDNHPSEINDTDSTKEISDSAGSSATDSSSKFIDADSDGYSEMLDCDDHNPNIYPNAPESDIPNGIDENCDKQDGYTKPDSKDSDSEICAATEFTISPSPVALMILQDMSLSMAPWPDGSYDGKWAIAKIALENLLKTFKNSEIAFGFDMFPNSPQGPKGCEVSTKPKYDCAMNIADTISGNLPWKEVPHGSTPLVKAMDNYLKADYAPGCMNKEWQTYLMIVSDGADSCTVPTIEELSSKTTELLNSGIKTFTIGFGDDADPKELNAISAAGGTMFTKYLPASDQSGLETAFNKIAKSLVNCNYDVPLVGNNADSNKVNFYFNEKIVPMDEQCKAQKGWRWVSDEKKKVLFCEDACNKLQSGETIKVSAT